MSTNEKAEDQLVELSVSGTSFMVRRQLLVEHEWMLSKMLDNNIPWAIHHNGRYYIDQDPVAFRWVFHYTRCQYLPTGILGSVNELEVIRSLADFLCFQDLVDYVDENIAKCMDVRSRVEELEKEITKLKRSHANEINNLQKERAALEANHKKEISPLEKLGSKLDGMDGITFICGTAGNYWDSSRRSDVVVLWEASMLNVDRSRITCPLCNQGVNSGSHKGMRSLIGDRGAATTATSITSLGASGSSFRYSY